MDVEVEAGRTGRAAEIMAGPGTRGPTMEPARKKRALRASLATAERTRDAAGAVKGFVQESRAVRSAAMAGGGRRTKRMRRRRTWRRRRGA